MSVIRVLPEQIANRIAAGEVIERPASVVKELVENAIDAGATRVNILARQGGRSLIQVTDDGCGMDRDDVLLCLEAHATSKVRDARDIEQIVTLGFRGEALPSIAAVSRFHLQSRQREELAGNEVIVDGGTVREFRECGCAPGTSVRVAQLFGNVPGRRKFLRSPGTENEHIQETVLLQALAHPGVAFELALDEQVALRVSASADPGERVAMLLGREVFEGMLPVRGEEGGITVSGFVARPGLTRGSRREQRFFVNGRPAAADVLFFALRDAYHTLVMKGRYPPAVLYLQLPPERVDVNVHPAKREVRFREGRLVAEVVAAAVGRALRGVAGDWRQPFSRSSPPAGGQPAAFVLQPAPEQTELPWRQPAGSPAGSAPLRAIELPAPPAPLPASPPPPAPLAAPAPDTPAGAAGNAQAEAGLAVPVPARPSSSATAGTSPSSATRGEIRQLRVLGVLGSLYLVAEGGGGLVLIDQHAAHERILFERLLRAAAEREPERQPLLLPVPVELAPADAALLRRHQEHFNRLGFQLEPFGGSSFLVTAVPCLFPRENIAGLLRDTLDELRQMADSLPRLDEVRIAQAACKHAVKAEDPLAPDEVARLLADLAQAEMPYTCPHGRPVMITLPHAEIERRFGRRT